MENDFLYQHDNAKYHVSQQVQTKLHELGVKILKWAAKSPDLNVIEHLWSIVDDKLKSKSISSVKELTEALSTEWLSMKPELLINYPFRCQRKFTNVLQIMENLYTAKFYFILFFSSFIMLLIFILYVLEPFVYGKFLLFYFIYIKTT